MKKNLMKVVVNNGQLVKMLITLEPHGIFGYNFAYFVYVHRHTPSQPHCFKRPLSIDTKH